MKRNSSGTGPIHTTNKQKTTVSITPAIRERAASMAQRRGMSLSMFIEQLLRAEITKEDEAQRPVAAAANTRRT